MAIFIGEHTCKVDAKGRLMLPAALKKQLPDSAQNTFVIKKDVFENCLVMFPQDEWNRQIKIIREKINPYNKEHNMFLRSFFKGSAEIEMDSSNRMLIPRRLLDLVGVEKEVILAGQDGKVEIWPKAVYEASGMSDGDFAALAEKIMGGNLNQEEL